ncbi:MAG TPA: hypothetical protein VLB68_24065 [Pyrinomonadaceae bacterium]|nr:hypothetical protein [Pyrinomonadaceae bacterium]
MKKGTVTIVSLVTLCLSIALIGLSPEFAGPEQYSLQASQPQASPSPTPELGPSPRPTDTPSPTPLPTPMPSASPSPTNDAYSEPGSKSIGIT